MGEFEDRGRREGGVGVQRGDIVEYNLVKAALTTVRGGFKEWPGRIYGSLKS